MIPQISKKIRGDSLTFERLQDDSLNIWSLRADSLLELLKITCLWEQPLDILVLPTAKYTANLCHVLEQGLQYGIILVLPTSNYTAHRCIVLEQGVNYNIIYYNII